MERHPGGRRRPGQPRLWWPQESLEARVPSPARTGRAAGKHEACVQREGNQSWRHHGAGQAERLIGLPSCFFFFALFPLTYLMLLFEITKSLPLSGQGVWGTSFLRRFCIPGHLHGLRGCRWGCCRWRALGSEVTLPGPCPGVHCGVRGGARPPPCGAGGTAWPCPGVVSEGLLWARSVLPALCQPPAGATGRCEALEDTRVVDALRAVR